MGDQKVIGPSDRYTIHKANSGGIRFKMKTAGLCPEMTLIAGHEPNMCLYKITFGHVTRVFNLGDKQEEKFALGFPSNFNEFSEYYVTWHNNKIKIGVLDHHPFVDYDRIYTEPNIGFVLFKTECKPSTPVEWIIEVSPVILKSISCKVFHDTLYWLPMINGNLPPEAMIGGFEKELTYIARSEINNSMCPGKYVPSIGKALFPWGHREHFKENFEILCGFNAKWVKTRTNYIPQNAFIGGRSEVQNEPLYIGRAMIDGKLIPGKVHVRYNTCFLPCDGKEIEVSLYEILVIPDANITQALPLPD